MSDLISRQAAIDAMNARFEDIKLTWRGKVKKGEIAMYLDMRGVIETLPSAEPVQHGKWKWLSCTYDRVPKEKEYECSECHHKTIVHGDYMPWEKYCPNCGCRMDAE